MGLLFLFIVYFFEKSSSFCRENEIFKNKKTKKNKNLDQFLTLEKAKIGPVFNSTAYIYVVKSIIGPSLAIFKVNNWAKSKSIIGPRSFSHYKNRGFRRFFLFSYHCVCVCVFCSQLSGNFLKIAFFKKRVQKLGFSIFCVLSLNVENSLFLGLLKHYKNRGFS